MQIAMAHTERRPAEALAAGPTPEPPAAVDRAAQTARAALYAAVIDEVDHGIILLGGDGRVLLVNRAAAHALQAGGPLVADAGGLRMHDGPDAHALQAAIEDAAHRGRRALITLGTPHGPWLVGVVPLPVPDVPGGGVVQLILPRPSACSGLTLTMYAHAHGLTLAEAQVLQALCEGDSPSAIARRHDVALCTVRTQIGHIRAKTRTRSIRALVQRVGTLPPLVSVLGHAVAASVSPTVRGR